MKTYETKIIPATPEKAEQRCTGRTCDLCGVKAARGDDWQPSSFYINETTITIEIKHKDGYSCPDGGAGTETEIDLCPACFKGKLVPWLRSQGADIRETEWDW